MSAALTDVDRDALLAERAEAEAQLRAAEATLGVPPTGGGGHAGAEQEREEPAQKPHDVEVQSGSVVQLDVEALRAAAARARQADDQVALAASEAAERPPAIETPLGSAETAFGRMLEIREELPATWRRLVGALISATVMSIVVGALGWNVYWLLVPIALILIMTVDLRLAGKSLREASAQASQELASVGGAGPDDLDGIRSHRTRIEEAEARLAAARAERQAAYARFEELAPGRLPSEVDDIVSEYEAERAAQASAGAERAAQAEAEQAAEPDAVAEHAVEAGRAAEPDAVAEHAAEAEPAAEPDAEAEDEPARPPAVEAAATAEEEPASEPAEQDATAPMPAVSEAAMAAAPSEPGHETAAVTATEWWFGTTEAPEAPPAAATPVRALAERLSAEGRDALARIQAQLDALERVELAKKSLEWHEANGSFESTGAGEPAADTPPEKS